MSPCLYIITEEDCIHIFFRTIYCVMCTTHSFVYVHNDRQTKRTVTQHGICPSNKTKQKVTVKKCEPVSEPVLLCSIRRTGGDAYR